MLHKIAADESVSFNIVKNIIDEKFDVISVLKCHSGMADIQIPQISIDNKAILITEDSDFGKWVFSHNQKPFCVIFLRYNQSEINQIKERLIKILTLKIDQLINKFIVITPEKIRIRDIIN